MVAARPQGRARAPDEQKDMLAALQTTSTKRPSAPTFLNKPQSMVTNSVQPGTALLSLAQQGFLDRGGCPPSMIHGSWTKSTIQDCMSKARAYRTSFSARYGKEPMSGTQTALFKVFGIAMPAPVDRSEDSADDILRTKLFKGNIQWWMVRVLHWQFNVPFTSLFNMADYQAKMLVNWYQSGAKGDKPSSVETATEDNDGNLINPFGDWEEETEQMPTGDAA